MFQNKNLSVLTSNFFFKGVEDSVINTIFNSKNFRAEKEGELIFQAGDESRWLYLILQGEVKIKYSGTKGSNASFRRVKNEFFGEQEIIDKTSRISSAVADTDCIFYLISTEELNQLSGKHKSILQNLSYYISKEGKPVFEENPAAEEPVSAENYIPEDNPVSENVPDDTPGTRNQDEIVVDEDISDFVFDNPANEELYDFNTADDQDFTESEENENLDYNNLFENIPSNGSEISPPDLTEFDSVNNDTTENPAGYQEEFPEAKSESEDDEQIPLQDDNEPVPLLNDFENIPEEPQKFAFSDSFDSQEKLFGGASQVETATLIESAQKFLMNNLNIPLSEIRRYTDYLKKTPNPGDIRYINDIISKHVEVISATVKSTFELLTGKSEMNAEVVNADEVYNEILALLSDYIESKNSVLYKKIESQSKINADKYKLFFAVQQLAKNACEAMPEGGNIFVTVYREDNSVKLEFADEGLGVPSSLTFEIFEPLVTHGKSDGAGLGLSVARKIILEHGGGISVDGELGEGTKILISLPAA